MTISFTTEPKETTAGNRRPVFVGKEQFPTLTAAANKFNITPSAMRYRINSKAAKWVGFYYAEIPLNPGEMSEYDKQANFGTENEDEV